MNTAPLTSSSNWGLLANPVVQSVLGILILMIVCSIAFYVVSKLRDSNNQDVLTDEQLRKNFEEMRSGGYINESEFRNIASLLAEQPRRSSMLSPKTSAQPEATNSDEK
jgi:uncharacterized membrane protein